MHLGIVCTNENHGETVLGLLETASIRGWQLRCFLSDSGVMLVNEPGFIGFAETGHWLALCEMSLERFHMSSVDVLTKIPSIIIGGQYQDAELVRNSDRVLVF